MRQPFGPDINLTPQPTLEGLGEAALGVGPPLFLAGAVAYGVFVMVNGGLTKKNR